MAANGPYAFSQTENDFWGGLCVALPHIPAPQETGLAGIGGFSNIARIASRGNRLATVISAFAFAFSGVSFYETVIKQPRLTVFVPPVLQYGQDGGGDTELFAIPITISNDGARTGTVLSMELEVENTKAKGDAPKTKVFYSAFFGEHPRNGDTPNKPFAPLSIAGRASASETIRFYPQGNPLPHLIQDAGEFQLTLKLVTAAAPASSIIDRIFKHGDPEPLMFQRTLPWFSQQQLGVRRVSISMHAKDWKPTVSAGK
jgi:hypothetical protein